MYYFEGLDFGMAKRRTVLTVVTSTVSTSAIRYALPSVQHLRSIEP